MIHMQLVGGGGRDDGGRMTVVNVLRWCDVWAVQMVWNGVAWCCVVWDEKC